MLMLLLMMMMIRMMMVMITMMMIMNCSMEGMTDKNVFSLIPGLDYCKWFSP